MSHNLPAVAALCRKGILLKEGRLLMVDTAENAIARYKKEGTQTDANATTIAASARSGTGTHRIEFLTPLSEEFDARSPMAFGVKIKQLKEDARFHLSLHFRNE
ncbi:MAG TPA: hypothetical protein PK954_05955, partial [Anaerolineales bacterium]|nr:hypothetical protein [Anaerolineales bacterium]